MNTTVYFSEDAPAHKCWLAHLDLGNCHMNFFSDTKLKAVEKAERWFASEKERQLKIIGNNIFWDKIKAENTSETNNPWAKIDGRGQGFAGKVWMLNRATGNRARVEADQVATYQSQGYVVAGPRSK